MGEVRIDGGTRLTGLIGGEVVTHSPSPSMHTASFAHNGINAVYAALNVKEDELENAIKGLRALGFIGCNVTMPYKTAVPSMLDELSDAAELMGAVNTIVVGEDGKLSGHNTDGAGFMRNAAQHGVDLSGETITVVGGGGAGSAIITQAALDGVAKINVFNIKDPFFDQLKNKLERLSKETGAKAVLHDLEDKEALRAAVAESRLFANATRVGMAPLEDQCTLEEDMLHEGLVVADTVYLPRKTKLLSMAQAHGNQTLDGVGMLLEQGSTAEHLWFGEYMDIPVIEAEFFAE